MEWKSKHIINGKEVEVTFKGITGKERSAILKRHKNSKDDEDMAYGFLATAITDIPLEGWADMSIAKRKEALSELWEAELDALANEYGRRREAVTKVKKPSTSP